MTEDRHANALHADADVRELAVEIIRSLDLIARNYDSYEYGLPVMTHYDEMVDTVVALLRTLRGEGEPVAYMVTASRYSDTGVGRVGEWLFDGPAECEEHVRWLQRHQSRWQDVRVTPLYAARRGEAQGEDDVGEVCHLCGEEFDPRGSGTVTGPLGQDDGVPRWYRCPRCARAYDAGYQQGQRDPRGDETADPTALRSEAQGDAGALAAADMERVPTTKGER